PLPDGYRPLASLPSLGDASIPGRDCVVPIGRGDAVPTGATMSCPTQAAAWQTTGAFAPRAGSGRHR
ncbi:hypothetical protein, partial [Rhizobium leguminosarum]|uniref:hypothetical protein n=1 Tax=Rhizobium leguminosarum TaxID=384 RepID=UPI00197E3D31